MPNPASLCLLRLSALGDVSHILPLVAAIRRQQPVTRIHWVLGQGEAKLLAGIPGVELIPFAKGDGSKGMRTLWQRLHGQSFDALLLMQLALRANILSLGIRAQRRIGYDRARSKEGHAIFIRERIAEHPRGHVLETLCRFGAPIGVHVNELLWNFAIPDEAHDFAQRMLPARGVPLMGISPCSSHALRNWQPRRYAEVARHAYRRQGMEIVLLGGRSKIETEMRDAIKSCAPELPFIDLVGKDSLKEMLALLARLDVLLCPDAGPAHLASALSVPVLGLYAATDPNRSGPYRSIRWCANAYAKAARARYAKSPEQLPWGKRVEYPGVMDLISIEEMNCLLDHLLATPVDQRLEPARLRA